QFGDRLAIPVRRLDPLFVRLGEFPARAIEILPLVLTLGATGRVRRAAAIKLAKPWGAAIVAVYFPQRIDDRFAGLVPLVPVATARVPELHRLDRLLGIVWAEQPAVLGVGVQRFKPLAEIAPVNLGRLAVDAEDQEIVEPHRDARRLNKFTPEAVEREAFANAQFACF